MRLLPGECACDVSRASAGMSISTFEARATSIWFDEDNMWLNLADGRQLSVPLVYFSASTQGDKTAKRRG